MTLNQIKTLVDKYLLSCLNNAELDKHSTDTYPFSNQAALNHAAWMCNEIKSMSDRDKAMRWLCFVQGILWMTQKRTIDDMRDDNR